MSQDVADAADATLWARLRAATPARIGLGRVGHTLPLDAVLAFQLDHARARDAVHAPFDAGALAADLAPLATLAVASAAGDRATYLRRPDLGRRLSDDSAARLTAAVAADPAIAGCDVVIVVGDGLSATGVQAGAPALVRALVAELHGLSVAPVVIASGARVALGDAIGEVLRARACIMVIGERPGLSVADSLGIYLTFGPRVGRADSERNCISNIHANGGLTPAMAAATLGRLLREALRRGLTGVDLKDMGEAVLPAANPLEIAP
ncbi:ethanolamine ammonia-lyase subunit EutC [Novosphingobium sp.]|uniref:ethanolamine ammonia-lyase subunit EutC n=1 Tax=Novosphingobium sp. TaxID=1874826 RepID=UPI00333EEE78